MKITLSDGLTVEIDTKGIIFDGQYACFADVEGQYYRVNARNIVWIGEEM